MPSSHNGRAFDLASAGFSRDADVLVIGGGPAGAWAAWAAAVNGAEVVLVDKGFCGISGAAASADTGVWYVAPDPVKRLAAIESREQLSGYLQDRGWMARVLDRTFESVNLLAEWGYPFPHDDNGQSRRTNLRGLDYMKLMRRQVRKAGVAILDHSPALELLADEDGAVAGARGLCRQQGRTWAVHAKAVVMATGGCAFLSGGLGCDGLTGDGYLMAAELGAEFTGMEFSNAYALSPTLSSVTKTLFYHWAKFTYEDGSPIPGAASHIDQSVIARTLLSQAVYCQIDKADKATRVLMRDSQPNFFVPLDRAGIDPFHQRFPVTLRLEGTVCGTGGLQLADETCATTVPGLFAAGDAATRQLVCGSSTGGGSHNAAWAMSSGFWAGVGATDYARQSTRASSRLYVPGGVSLDDNGGAEFDPTHVIRAVQAEVFPYDKNYFRTAGGTDGVIGQARHAMGGRARRGAQRDGTGREGARGCGDARHVTLDVLERPRAQGEPRHA